MGERNSRNCECCPSFAVISVVSSSFHCYWLHLAHTRGVNGSAKPLSAAGNLNLSPPFSSSGPQVENNIRISRNVILINVAILLGLGYRTRCFWAHAKIEEKKSVRFCRVLNMVAFFLRMSIFGDHSRHNKPLGCLEIETF